MHSLMLRVGVGKESYTIRTENVSMAVHSFDSKGLNEPVYINLF
jgi:hypothetical protein